MRGAPPRNVRLAGNIPNVRLRQPTPSLSLRVIDPQVSAGHLRRNTALGVFTMQHLMNMSRTLYGESARFDHATVLTEDTMRRVAPSIFATEKHASRSERFQPIPTIEVLRGLQKEGFSVVAARQSIVRQDDRKDFTKHMVRLRRLDDEQKYKVGDTVFEVLLKNANDGTAAYDLIAGLFRILCMNSLVAQTDNMESLRVRHSGDVAHKVIEGTYRVLDTAQQALTAPQDWPAITLNRDEAQVFAEAAHTLRFADAEGNVATPIKPQQLLIPRRREDQGANLWNVFNIVQENAVRGGLTAVGRDTNNRPRRTTTRGVNGIDQDVKLNRALFTLASKMAELKQAA